MMTLGQKLVAVVTIILLNVMFVAFFGVLAIVPVLFSIVALAKIRQL